MFGLYNSIRALCLKVAFLSLMLAVSGCMLGPLRFAGSGTSADTPADIIPVSSEAHDKGVRHFQSGDYGLSERAFRDALAENPTNADTWLGLAASYDRLSRFDEADKAYRRAIRLAPKSPVVWNNLGFSYILRGKLNKADKTLQKASRLDDADPRIQSNIALLAAVRSTGGKRGG